MGTNLGEFDEVSKRDSLIKILEREKVERFGTCLHTYEGREFVWNLLEWCNVFSVAPLVLDEIQRYEGRRDVGLHVLDKLFTSYYDAYSLMQIEAEKRQTREDEVNNDDYG